MARINMLSEGEKVRYARATTKQKRAAEAGYLSGVESEPPYCCSSSGCIQQLGGTDAGGKINKETSV